MRSLTALFAVIGVAGCASVALYEFDQRHGTADPRRFDVAVKPPTGMSYRADVQPILDRRCVVCHGCYDAPCQLKLGAWEGVARGISQQPVYDAGRLLEAPTTRLFIDAQLPSQWRQLGFSSVLNDRTQNAQNNLAASVLYRSLALKRDHPLPDSALLSNAFDVSAERASTCPRIEQFDAFGKQHPLAGMPYGLPGLNEREFSTITRWLEAGAPFEGDPPLTVDVQQQVQLWEAFLNGESNKERLMSRYLYEHLFLGHLYFETGAQPRWFSIVRSSTPTGVPIMPIATRRPFDDPQVARFYYRLQPERESLLAKTHMPYALSPARMDKFKTWFLSPAYAVKTLPSYEVEVASNPFVAFRDLPIDGRYRFLLDESEFFVMNFIKGPVCRGDIAVDVIEDRFWVFFVEPTARQETTERELIARQQSDLQLPAAWGSNSLVLLPWLEYSKREQQFLKAKSQALEQSAAAGQKIDTSVIWNGDGRNPNAALTIFRHFDSATVVKGLVGDSPKTAWVMDYSLLERIYYLLVAGYDVYGNAGHQLNSRLYMDFLRMEGEFNFLVFLPQATRISTANYWYRGAPSAVTDYVYGSNAHFNRSSDITFKTSDPQQELYGLLRARVAPAISTRFDWSAVREPALRSGLQALAATKGAGLAWLPEATFLRIDAPGAPSEYFTLLRNTAHKNVAHMFKEAQELVPAENTLTVAAGFVGAYPNAIFRASAAELPALAAAIASMSTEADYRKLADRFAIRRTNPQFWAASDQLIDAYSGWGGIEAGLFDYSRLQNR